MRLYMPWPERLRKPLYMIQGHEDLTAEDLVVSATIAERSAIKYVASPLVSAMIRGGICFIDEIAKMRPRALAPLASVLDERRSVSSALLGTTFTADPSFLFCAAYNPTDADAFDLAPWLRRRTLPEIEVRAPSSVQLEEIVRQHDHERNDGLLSSVLFQYKRRMGEDPDPGTAIRLVTYVRRLRDCEPYSRLVIDEAIELAIGEVVGAEKRKAGKHKS